MRPPDTATDASTVHPEAAVGAPGHPGSCLDRIAEPAPGESAAAPDKIDHGPVRDDTMIHSEAFDGPS